VEPSKLGKGTSTRADDKSSDDKDDDEVVAIAPIYP